MRRPGRAQYGAAHRRGPWEIFRVPILLGLASAIGLTSALLADGPWDAVSWAGLGLPLIVAAWCFGRA